MARQLVQSETTWETAGPGMDKEIQQPLTLVMPVAMEHLDRLKATLRNPAVVQRSPLALDKVGTVHASRFVILEDEGEDPQWAKLLVIAIFDGSFEAYIEAFAREMRDIFNGLLACVVDTEDKPNLPVENDVEGLMRYVRNRNVGPASGQSYSAYPDLSALDIYEATRARRDLAPTLGRR